MSLAMARIRLLAADAYRLGCRDKDNPNRDAARELVSQALRDLEMRLDMEGIVAKRKEDPYARGVAWFKVKNPRYTKAAGRGNLFNRPRRK
jgi:hypothetical protein